ncbi:gliding motility-associated C-terminal domain-containing protein [Polluticoccus soli]|uniref:Ig-like domain-containing protein n=1 Tax=Polluticoccus soli TaxID=3034150 RepID=UPI0023E266DD|nr:gliding motility-associated C-terminal domain-containing protein [Flavipsychrobacter sp. JY13-12]
MRQLVLTLVVLLSLLALSQKASASHAAGGELIYEWIADSTYRVIFKFYRDCGGSTEPTTQVLCYRNMCTNQTYQTNMDKLAVLPGGVANGTPVATGCAGYSTECQNISSTIPGYREWWYVDTVTLPSRCTNWRFSTYLNARNTSSNVVGTPNFYAEATLNNVVAQGNSSPYFSVKPVPYVCINQAYSYNNGAVDINGDSLVFESQVPQTNGACNTNPTNCTFVSKTPALTLPSNPFQTNNSFALNANTGAMNFTPTEQGAQTVSMKVKEYRNGVLIGTVMRDIQVQVLNCTNTPPTVTPATSTFVNASWVNNQVQACATTTFSFCYDAKSTAVGAKLIAQDNHTAATPGATVTYSNQLGDSVRGCFSWTPSAVDTGLKIFTVTVKDTTCAPPGIMFTQTFTIPIYVWPATQASKDTTICYGDHATLDVNGGSGFTWTVLPGGSPITSLTCTGCKNPQATPTVTTSYVVTSTIPSPCINRDTVVVTVNNPTAPSALTNSPVCPDSTLKLSATTVLGASGYDWNGPNSFSSNLQNPVITNAQIIHSGIYGVRSIVNGCYSQYAYVVATVGYPQTPTPSSNSPVCEGGTLNLTASTVSGATYTWTGPNSFTSAAQNPSITNVAPVNSGYYKITSTAYGCTSLPDSTLVVINPLPVAPTVANITHCQDIAAPPLTATGSGLLWYTTATGGTGSATAITPSTSTPGTTTYWVSQTVNGCEGPRASIAVTILPKPVPPTATISYQYCQFATATQLTATGSSLKWYTAAIGGTGNVTAPTPTTASGGSTSWYVTQTGSNGCESDRLPITVVVVPLSSPPTVTTANYCQYLPATPDISTMVSGGNILWYTGATGGTGSPTAPTVSTSSATTYTYYVTQNINTCESQRVPINAIVHPKPLLPVPTSVVYCQFDIANPLVAVGTNLLWYTTPTGGTGSATTPIPSTNTAGTFNWYVSQTANGCESDRAQVVVTVKPQPAPPLVASNIDYCQFDIPAAILATGQNVVWYATATGGTANTTVPTPTTGAPGVTTYYFTQTVNGCESNRKAAVVIVKAKPVPPVVVSPIELCYKTTPPPLTATGANLEWFSAATGGTQFPTAPVPSTAAIGTSSYYVSQMVDGCRSDRSEIIVKVDSVVGATLALSKEPLCQYDSLEATYSGVIAPVDGNFTWSFDGGKVLSGKHAGPYKISWNEAGKKTVMVIATIPGCRGVGIKELTVLPAPPATFNLPAEFCVGQEFQLEATDSKLATYTWQLAPAETISGKDGRLVVKWNVPGRYVVGLNTVSQDGCASLPVNDTIVIREQPIAEIVQVSSNNICVGDTVSLTGRHIESYTYKWTPAELFDNSETIRSTATLHKSAMLVLTVTDTIGCRANDSAYINAQLCCDLYMPNAFSPNGDGKNDVFRVLTPGHNELVTFLIKNRFGETVFFTSDVNKGWDGIYMGEPQDVGTYFYYLQYKCADASIHDKKGDVVLVR